MEEDQIMEMDIEETTRTTDITKEKAITKGRDSNDRWIVHQQFN